MQIDLLLLKRMLLAIVVFMGITLPSQGQIPLTIDKAMEIAQENSPSLRRSYMNLERYKQNLIAQKASLKSRFSLNLNPLDYNKNRRFDNRLSQWYTNETLNRGDSFQLFLGDSQHVPALDPAAAYGTVTELDIRGVLDRIYDFNHIRVPGLCDGQGLRILAPGFAVLSAPASAESTAFLTRAFRVFADRGSRNNESQKSCGKLFAASHAEVVYLRVAQLFKAFRELPELREVAASPAGH